MEEKEFKDKFKSISKSVILDILIEQKIIKKSQVRGFIGACILKEMTKRDSEINKQLKKRCNKSNIEEQIDWNIKHRKKINGMVKSLSKFISEMKN